MRFHDDHYESLKFSRDEMCGVLDTHGYRIRIHIPERKLFSRLVNSFEKKSGRANEVRKPG